MNSKATMDQFQVGEIYKIQGSNSHAESRLVLLVEIDTSDYSALAYLLNNMTDAAIPRDLRISKEKLNSKFDLVLMTEYLARIDLQNLASLTKIGILPKDEVEKIRSISFANPFGQLPDSIESEGIRVGRFPVQRNDSVWFFRENEFENFRQLTFSRNKLSSDYVSRILELYDDLSPILDDCPIDALFLRGRVSIGASA
jgi:hypothetical protein